MWSARRRDKRAKFLAAVVKDLKAAGAEALVVAGPRQPASVHALAALINQTLGSGCVAYTKPASDKSEFRRRRAEGADGRNVGGPGFDAGDAGRQSGLHGAGRSAIRGRRLSKVANSIHLGAGRRRNRGGREVACAGGALSSKAGAMRRPSTASLSIQQPMIEPMFGGKTAAEMVALVIDAQGQKGLRHRQELLARAVARARIKRTDLAEGAERRHRRVGTKPADAVKVIARRQETRGGARGGAESRRRTESKSRSFRALRPGTAASPTTAGCRKRRTRSPS